MTLNEILYSLEHDILPRSFYDDKKTFIGLMASSPVAIYEIINELFKRNGQDNPFRPGDFSVEPTMINDQVAMLKLKFPNPPASPLCHRSFVFFDKSFEKTMYFCMEKGDEISGGFPVICSWEPDGSHVSYGSESPDEDEQMVRCAGIYLERWFGEENSSES